MGTEHNLDVRAALEVLQREFDQHRQSGPTVAELWERYAKAKKGTHRSWVTVVGQMRAPLKHFGERRAMELTYAALEEYCTERLQQRTAKGRPPSPQYLTAELSRLRAVLNWASDDALLITYNPVRRVPNPEVPRKPKASFGEDELDALMAAAHQQGWWPPFADLLLLRFDTGMRPTEARELQWDRVDSESSCIRLRAEDTKTRRARIVPLTPRALEAIKRQKRHIGCPWVFPGRSLSRPISHAHVSRIWDIVKAMAGIVEPDGVRYTWHQLRHSWNHRARKRGLDISYRMRILGHATLSAHEHYDVVTEDDLVEAMQAFDDGIQREREQRRGPVRALPPQPEQPSTDESGRDTLTR